MIIASIEKATSDIQIGHTARWVQENKKGIQTNTLSRAHKKTLPNTIVNTLNFILTSKSIM